MTEQMRAFFDNFLYMLLWLIFAVLVTLTLFQLHGTIIAIAVYVVNDPALRPYAWNSGSVVILARFLWLIMGILWLGWVPYTYEYLSEGSQLKILTKRSFRLILILGSVYLSSYLILLSLA